MQEFVNVQSGSDASAGIKGSAPVRDPSCAKSNYASSLGDICERRLVLQRTRGNEAVPVSYGLAGIFDTSNLVTPVFIDRIFNPFGRRQAPAWELREQERRAHDGLFTKLEIGCQVDGVRHVADATGRMRPYNVVEFKALGMIYDQIHSIEDIGKTHWTAKYPDQLLLGMLGCDLTEHAGWLCLINKANLYDCKVFEVPFDHARCETLLKRAERINGHTAAGTRPEPINRPDICPNCPMVAVCAPKLQADPEDAPIVFGRDKDPELYQLLQDHVALEETKKVAEKNHDTLKKRLVPGQKLVCEELVVSWRVHGRGWRMEIVDTSQDRYAMNPGGSVLTVSPDAPGVDGFAPEGNM